MKNIYKYLLVIFFTIGIQNLYGQSNIDSFDNKDVVEGKIRLKIKEKYLLNPVNTNSEADVQGKKSTSGIDNLDNVNSKVGITRMQRVFPFSIKFESKHREYGLHQWYELDFDKDLSLSYVLEQYSSLSEIEIAKPVYKKVNVGYEGDPIKITASNLNAESGDNKSEKSEASLSALEETDFNDPLLDDQWHYYNTKDYGDSGLGRDIDLINAWTKETGSSDIVVAIVDGGIDVHHEDISANLWINEAELNGEEGIDDDGNGYIDDINGTNFVYGGLVTAHSHGTHVAGTVGAVTNNSIGVAGVAGGDGSGNGVRLMSCQVFDDRATSSGNFAAAIVYGADNGAVISQNSWGYTQSGYYEPEVFEAIKYFKAEAGNFPGSPMQGGVLFFAAGNDGLEQTHYPGAFEEVVAVSAIGPTGYPAVYTNRGDWIDIAAPGGDQAYYGEEGGVLSTLPGNEYGYYQGTSMACPHVSGVAALVVSKFGGDSFTNDDLESIIINSATPFIFDDGGIYGKGVLNAVFALSDDEKIAPNKITDLSSTKQFHNAIELTWTIPADEDNFQPDVLYLAVSLDEINSANFDDATIFPFSNPYKAGTTVNVTLNGLRNDTKYWFALKSSDMFNNVSDISNILEVSTTKPPKFVFDETAFEINIDVNSSTTAVSYVNFKNTGEGIIDWSSYINNEVFYFEEQEEIEEEVESRAVEYDLNISSLSKTFSQSNEKSIFMPVEAFNQNSIQGSNKDFWKTDNTVYTAGITYENENPASSLFGSRNRVSNYIHATRFNIDIDYTFNLTHIEVALYPQVNDEPIIVELRKGSKDVTKAETVYYQYYYPDTTDVFKIYRIPLHKAHRFEDGDIFWVVMHHPQSDPYPLGVFVGGRLSNYFMSSDDNGRTFENMQNLTLYPYTPLLRALSTGDDGSYVFLDPNEGEINAGDTQQVKLQVDAENLTNGKHLASVSVITNDDAKAVVSMEMRVNVSGQKAEVNTSEVHNLTAYVERENLLDIDIKNIGLADLEIYDITSNNSKITKVTTDTISVVNGFEVNIEFKYQTLAIENENTSITLKTNNGDINIPLYISVKENAELYAYTLNSDDDLSTNTTNNISVVLKNESSSVNLEYNVEKYSNLNTSTPIISESLEYTSASSNTDSSIPSGLWDEIEEIGTEYDASKIWLDSLEFKHKIPYFNELTKYVHISSIGDLSFYDLPYANSTLPQTVSNDNELGYISAFYFANLNLGLEKYYYHSFGDRTVFTIERELNSEYNSNYDENVTVKYQIVLFRDGTIEYRYKDIENIRDEDNYRIVIHGMSVDEFEMYKDFENTDNKVHNGTVVRFTPKKNMNIITNIDKTEGSILPGDSTILNLEIDASKLELVAGYYENNLSITSNISEGQFNLPVNINLSGSAYIQCSDTLSISKTNVGHVNSSYFKVENNGFDKVEIEDITFNNSLYSYSSALPYNIEGLSEIFLPISFSPIEEGSSDAIMTIKFSNGQTKMVEISSLSKLDPNYTLDIADNIEVDLIAGEKTIIPFNIITSLEGEILEYTAVNSTFTSVISSSVKNGEGDANEGDIDEYGYSWDVSDENRVFYKWEDITDDSEVLLIENNVQRNIKLPFSFPFYGDTYNEIWVSKNGYISVIEPTTDFADVEFMKDDGISGMIAPFWTQIVPPSDDKGVLFKQDDNRILLQWNKFIGEESNFTGGTVTFQLEINSDGVILFHYKDVMQWRGLQQYGLESPDENETFETPRSWILKWSIINDSTTIAITPPLKETLNSGNSKKLDLQISAENIYKSGSYVDSVVVYSNSHATPKRVIPVKLNVVGTTELGVEAIIDGGQIIFSENAKLEKIIELSNKGQDVVEIDNITFNNFDGLKLYDASNNVIVKTSSGRLANSIAIDPWSKTTLKLEIPISEFKDLDGSIYFDGNFSTVTSNVKAKLVETPNFSWNAEDQLINMVESEEANYSFTIKNTGDTELEYKIIPAVKPKNEGENDDVQSSIVGNFTLDKPVMIDSMANEFKESADAVFTPMVSGVLLAFSSKYTAPEDGFIITHVKVYQFLKKEGEYVSINIFKGGDEPHEDNLAYKQEFVIDQPVKGDWVYFPLETPITIEPGENFHIAVVNPVEYKYIGYDIASNKEQLESVYVGVYWSEGIFKWYSSSEEGSNQVYKIRALTAAGDNQWLTVDKIVGRVAGGQEVEVTANVNTELSGSGQHDSYVIVKTNDVNNPKDQINISVDVNGFPIIEHRPNNLSDTLRINELEEVTYNYLAFDPEGDKITYELVNLDEQPNITLTQNSNEAAKINIKTDYNSAGVYVWDVKIMDDKGNVSLDKLVVKINDKNRAPVLNEEYAVMYLNKADPFSVFTIDSKELFTDPDGDELSILAGNYTPELFEMALSDSYIDLHPLMEGTGLVAFGADDGKEDGFVVYGCYVVVLDDPDAVGGEENSFNGDKDYLDANELMIYPNPANRNVNQVNISYQLEQDSEISIELYNMSGAKCFESIADKFEGYNSTTVNIESLDSGIYLCKVLKNGKEFKVEKLIVK